MNQNSKNPLWVNVSIGTIGLFAVAAVWLYLSGAILLQLVNRSPDETQFLTFYQYWYHYGEVAAVKKKLWMAGGATLFVLGIPVFLFFKPNKESQHGDAKLASKRDMKKAGLMGESGVIIGQEGDQVLMYAGDAHVAIDAEPRSGKGVAIVVPNGLNWADSMVVNDTKQELHGLTSRYRERHGNECFLFNPGALDYRTHRWNPLAYISEDPNLRINDIQKIAGFIFPDVEGQDPIWTSSGRSLLLGTVLYLLETPELPVTLGAVLRCVTQEEEAGAYFKRVIAERIEAGNPLSGICMSALNDFIGTSEATRTSIRKTFSSRFEPFYNPLVDAATSANDFDFRDLRKKRMSIYVGIMPGDLDRFGPLLNLFWQQLIDCNTAELPNQNKALKHKVLLLLDELTACGKIKALLKGVAYLPGYGLKVLAIYHSHSQLAGVYGENEATGFAATMGVHIMFAPPADDPEDKAEKISKLLGNQTWKVTNKGKSSGKSRSRSENTSEQPRALMLPQEIRRIGMWKQFVFMANVLPILCKKVQYYTMPAFIDRLKEVSPSLAALGKALPTKEQLEDAAGRGELRAAVPLLNLTHTEYAFSPKPTEGDGPKTTSIVRPLTPADVGKLKQLKAEDFTCDFSDIEIPSEKPTDKELQFGVDEMLARFGMQA